VRVDVIGVVIVIAPVIVAVHVHVNANVEVIDQPIRIEVCRDRARAHAVENAPAAHAARVHTKSTRRPV